MESLYVENRRLLTERRTWLLVSKRAIGELGQTACVIVLGHFEMIWNPKIKEKIQLAFEF